MPLEVNAQAPDFTRKPIIGDECKLSDYLGKKPVVLIFATEDASPVRTQMIKEINDKTCEKCEIIVVRKNIPDMEMAVNFLTAMDVKFPVVLDDDNEISAAFAVETLPTSFFLDRDGKVLYVSTPPPEESETSLEKLEGRITEIFG